MYFHAVFCCVITRCPSPALFFSLSSGVTAGTTADGGGGDAQAREVKMQLSVATRGPRAALWTGRSRRGVG
jgi:hypothetical protein